VAEVDARPGGRYRLSMKTDAGEIHTVGGEYQEVDRPERLVYTWQWEAGPAPVQGGNETLVTVEFVEEGGGTLVKLTHTGFPSPEIMGMHEQGWNAVLARLESVL
jgi:glutathione S-transferase